MARYILRRLAALGLVLFGVTIVVFVISRVVPGDVALLWTGQRGEGASARTLALIREQYHLDRPLLIQYVLYLRDLTFGALADVGRLALGALALLGGDVDRGLDLRDLALGPLADAGPALEPLPL